MSARRFLAAASFVLTLSMSGGIAGAAFAQDDPPIDYGDDSSSWANDGECDDPRFEGRGMASGRLLESDRGHDAADCRAAVSAGRASLRDGQSGSLDGATDVAELKPTPTPEVEPQPEAPPISVENIDFGDDSSVWANDDECDDPRFSGEGVAASPQRQNVRSDATDCRAMVEAGQAVFNGELEPLWEGEHDDIDFGDNAGGFPDDGECDDPRFVGDNVALSAGRANALHDAHDCREAYDAGAATYVGEMEPAFAGVHDDIDFGDNEGSFPFDAECDDPRFTGANVAANPGRSNALHDSDDCRRAYDRGEATYNGELEPLFEGFADNVDYGDNSGPYVDDDECDDPRFVGEAVAAGSQRANVLRDAHDCHEAVVAGTATYEGELEPLFTGEFEGVPFGDNEGPYPEDRECDDPRFRGFGMAIPPWSTESENHDAHDCQWLLSRGFIRFVAADGLFEGSADGVDFGDNSGGFVNDGECDDARFEGPGVGATDGANDKKDAMDCWMNLQEGSIRLKE